MQPKQPPRGLKKKSISDESADGTENKPKYIKLKKPNDVTDYVQTVINRLRREQQELEQVGKITNLLNTWIAAYRCKMDTEDYKKLREELDEFKAKMEAR